MVEHPALHLEVAAFLKDIFARLQKRSGRVRDELGPLLMIAFSVFLSIAPDAAMVFTGVDVSDPAARERLWNALHARLFGPAVREPAVRVGGTKSVKRAAGSNHQKASPRLK
jgi:hypothetical protein